jgi:hypothetical protein
MNWKTTMRVNHLEVKLLVTDEEGKECLRARLPHRPEHPRALLTLLEGLALWSGAPLTAAVSVAGSARTSCDSMLFGGVVWPAESALVHVQYVDTVQPRRLRGLGSFREVLRAHRVENTR